MTAAHAPSRNGMRIRLPHLPAFVDSSVRHQRRSPRHYAFTSRVQHWLVDLADLPDYKGLGTFRASDHLDGGRLGDGIRGDLVRFLEHRDVHVADDDRLLMLASPRAWGYVFNPLSVFWCLDSSGQLRAAVLEVHNTYGERHAYLVHPNENGEAIVDKAFYVSPFNDVSGEYRVSLKLSPALVHVSVGLVREDALIFSASTTGAPAPITRRALVRAACSRPFATWRVSAGIRWHGIRLWASRLPVIPRRPHSKEEVQ